MADDRPPFTVVWSAALYRQKMAPGLSGMNGRQTPIGEVAEEVTLEARAREGKGQKHIRENLARASRRTPSPPPYRTAVPILRITPAHEETTPPAPGPCPDCGHTPLLWDAIGGGHWFCGNCLERDMARAFSR
jgi:hypothetical protein